MNSIILKIVQTKLYVQIYCLKSIGILSIYVKYSYEYRKNPVFRGFFLFNFFRWNVKEPP